MTDHDLSKVSSLHPVVQMHPHWCEWSTRCERDPSNADHRGLEVTWPLRSDDASMYLALTRYDEVPKNNPKIQYCGAPTIELTIRQTAIVNRDGSPIIAAAHLGLEDAELLLKFLGRHVDRLRRGFADVAQLDDERTSA